VVVMSQSRPEGRMTAAKFGLCWAVMQVDQLARQHVFGRLDGCKETGDVQTEGGDFSNTRVVAYPVSFPILYLHREGIGRCAQMQTYRTTPSTIPTTAKIQQGTQSGIHCDHVGRWVTSTDRLCVVSMSIKVRSRGKVCKCMYVYITMVSVYSKCVQ